MLNGIELHQKNFGKLTFTHAVAEVKYSVKPVLELEIGMGQSRPLFVYCRPLLIPATITVSTSAILIEKSVLDGVLRLRTQNCMMI